MTAPISNLLKLSDEARCVQNKDMAKIQRMPTLHSSVAHEKFGYLGTAQITIVSTRKASYYADQSTGTLYHMDTLRCLSGDFQRLRDKPRKTAMTKFQPPKKEA